MKRHLMMLFVCLLLTAGSAVAQRNFDNVEIKATRVSGNVYMLTGAGGNIGVTVGEDGILIVDDQFAPLADKIRTALKDIGGGKLRFILNTHWHGDHTGGNPVFGPEATIIAHTNVRKRLSSETRRGERVTPAMAKAGWPVITFDDSVSVHFNGEEIKVIHLPKGHTDGDSIIHFIGSNVVHMGDDFFAGSFPFVDLASGGTVQGLVRNIGQALEHIPADAKIIPGHGPLSTVSDLRQYRAMLVATTGAVQQKMNAGKSLDAIKAEGLDEKWASWGTGFINTERWIETIYNSYSQN